MWALFSWNNVLGVRRAFHPISFSSSMTDAFLHDADKVSLESWSGSLEQWWRCYANLCGASRGAASTS